MSIPEDERLTHVDADGAARMVDVADKAVTHRRAVAGSRLRCKPETVAMVVEGRAPKGDVIAVARVAGIMGAKRTSDLIPLCHPLALTKAEVAIEPLADGFEVTATVETDGKTGVEMEALAAATVTALTLYDMCKAVDRGMTIEQTSLLVKEGGKTGRWARDEETS